MRWGRGGPHSRHRGREGAQSLLTGRAAPRHLCSRRSGQEARTTRTASASADSARCAAPREGNHLALGARCTGKRTDRSRRCPCPPDPPLWGCFSPLAPSHPLPFFFILEVGRLGRRGQGLDEHVLDLDPLGAGVVGGTSFLLAAAPLWPRAPRTTKNRGFPPPQWCGEVAWEGRGRPRGPVTAPTCTSQALAASTPALTLARFAGGPRSVGSWPWPSSRESGWPPGQRVSGLRFSARPGQSPGRGDGGDLGPNQHLPHSRALTVDAGQRGHMAQGGSKGQVTGKAFHQVS